MDLKRYSVYEIRTYAEQIREEIRCNGASRESDRMQDRLSLMLAGHPEEVRAEAHAIVVPRRSETASIVDR